MITWVRFAETVTRQSVAVMIDPNQIPPTRLVAMAIRNGVPTILAVFLCVLILPLLIENSEMGVALCLHHSRRWHRCHHPKVLIKGLILGLTRPLTPQPCGFLAHLEHGRLGPGGSERRAARRWPARFGLLWLRLLRATRHRNDPAAQLCAAGQHLSRPLLALLNRCPLLL